jgi:hypothetical protein
VNHRPREGDFLLTTDDLIFDVKGMCHPPDRIISFVRYVPDPEGNRFHDGIPYGKLYDLEDRFHFLKERFPHYIYFDPVFHKTLQGVPHTRVKQIFDPVMKLKTLRETGPRDTLEEAALHLASSLAIPDEALGISGSLLMGMHTEQSDIDLIVYGKEQGGRAFQRLKKLRAGDLVCAFDSNHAREKALFRWGSSRKDLIEIEQKKILHGLFEGREYFIRLVTLSFEPYGYVQYIPQHKATLTGWVRDDSESIFTPCCYELSDSSLPQVTRLISFRGRYCEQVTSGEKIIARGTVEKVCTPSDEFYHMVLGDMTDFLFPVDFS